MSKAEILAELPKLSPRDRREILEHIIELDPDAPMLEERRKLADETFRMLDALEWLKPDAGNSATKRPARVQSGRKA
ncbi:MAG TPA: hypothetical protein VND64_19585 [Pirellulales bacterium]|nr:hypothetical protein [Pirellulales bacterium]